MVQYKLPMTGFELQTSGVGSNRSANWATTTAQERCNFYPFNSITEASPGHLFSTKSIELFQAVRLAKHFQCPDVDDNAKIGTISSIERYVTIIFLRSWSPFYRSICILPMHYNLNLNHTIYFRKQDISKVFKKI